METVYFLGIDVSKKTFDAALTLDGMNMYELEVENTAKNNPGLFSGIEEEIQFCILPAYCMPGTYWYLLLPYFRFSDQKWIQSLPGTGFTDKAISGDGARQK